MNFINPEKVRIKNDSPVQKNMPFTNKPVESQYPYSPLMNLQRGLGNYAFGCMIQANLKISEPGDVYEQEADRLAEQVMRIPEHRVQRQEEEPEEKEEPIQMKGNFSGESEVNPTVESDINSLKGGGQPLPESLRDYFEPRIGYDFSGVRLHTDLKAAESAHAINARAYTRGCDIVFGSGEYNPESYSGRKILAHELIHVVQQISPKRQKPDSGEKRLLRNTNSQLIQRYNEEVVHYNLTKIIAEKFFGSGMVSETIASECKKMDSGWTHPTPTSIYPFLIPANNVISAYEKQGLSKRARDRVEDIRSYFRRVRKAVNGISPTIKDDDVLHFLPRAEATRLIKSTIDGAKNIGTSFAQHAEKFGKVLHIFQDSFSHSFPMKPGEGYNLDVKARHDNLKEAVLAYFLRKTELQSFFPDTNHGKGAVIRHVILGHYPDDFRKNGEQWDRDNSMAKQTTNFIKQLYEALLINAQLLREFYKPIIDSAVTHNNRYYGIAIYQMKSNSIISLKALVNGLNETEGYFGENKKYYALTKGESNVLYPRINQADCFYSCDSGGNYIRISSIR